ncbi:hypothetical protein [Methylobacterium planeticum]|uniref:hypothetical protein n=1 Tax=Methylobacterium planeticum TaxID=2615211 RepID=UPI00177D2AAA|nr:hypothetical protein [Methylobacterium planeticum]
MSLVFALFLIGVPLALAVMELRRMRGGHSLPIHPVERPATAQPSSPSGGSPSI